MTPEAAATALEAEFNQVLMNSMQDMPMLHPDLQVEAVGFQLLEPYIVGVLITPWFMNLLLLSLQDAWQDRRISNKITMALPSGEYEFLVNEYKEGKHYLSCSLFSPMFEFENQDAARLTAEHCLEYMLAPPEPPPVSRRDMLRPWAKRP
jgi:[NiFe] hydrogenase assembly HybE family chaperone